MMKQIRFFLIPCCFALCVVFAMPATAQNLSYQTKELQVAASGSVQVSMIREDWNVRINNLEGIKEGNETYRQHLMQLKKESAARFPRKDVEGKPIQGASLLGTTQIPDPVIQSNFSGNAYSYSAPNDNTLAVSNSGQLISAINTNVYFYDLVQDTLLKTTSLTAFASSLTGISQHQYDPKLIYDPHQDRFILVFLAGSSADTTTHIVVAFTQTNDMMGSWNLYALPGNPLNDTSWTDYPAIALTEDELFITVNLLNYGASWQTSFKQSVIWQVDKFAGYQGNALNTKLWSDIEFDQTNIRNLNPIQGADALHGPNIFLLSNRNFSLYTDTIFLLEITGNLQNPLTQLNINCLKTDVGYGAPPDAKQPKTLNLLATNDARVLGGFIHNQHIQFVANTIDTTTGSAAIYHGFIRYVNTTPIATGVILKEPGFEYGYPNISYTGTNAWSQQAMIGFNHTGDTAYPGVSAIFYDGNGGYSNRVEIKTGTQMINIFSGLYERWGDYTGNQRKYNAPGTVWISGMYGVKVGVSMRLGTQIAEVVSSMADVGVASNARTLEASLFPNPVTDLFGMEFTLDQPQHVIVEVRALSGQVIHRLYDGSVKAGKNALTFSTQNLPAGTFLVSIIRKDGKVLFSEKVIKI
jgi:hypothetical protein